MQQAWKTLLSSGLLVTIGGYVLAYLPEKLTQLLPCLDIGRLAVGAILISALLLSYLVLIKWRFSPRANIKDYGIYHPTIGANVYKLKNDPDKSDTQRWFCANCMDSKRLAIHIQPGRNKFGEHCWHCPQCKTDI